MKLKQINLITRKLIAHYKGSVLLCTLSLACACALLMSVVAVQSQARQAFGNADMGFNAVVGPRGSRLQLVLNSLFHLDQANGVIPWQRYLDVKQDRRVKEAYPITVGDNYKGFRIIGCEPDLLGEHKFDGEQIAALEEGGRLFDPLRAEAVVGSFAAEQLQLELGSTFYSYHGLQFDETQRHDLEYTVVGILEPSNTPMDRAIWVPLESYYRMPGHELRGTGEVYIPQAGVAIDNKHKEVSAVLCNIIPSSGLALHNEINRNSNDMSFAWPVSTIVFELFDSLNWVEACLTIVACLVFVISTVFMSSTLYQHMQQQERDFVLLRSLGAGRGDLSKIIIGQALHIAVRSVLWSFVFYSVILGAAALFLRAETGVYLTLWYWDPILWFAPLLLLGLALVAAAIPALQIYTKHINEQLQDQTT